MVLRRVCINNNIFNLSRTAPAIEHPNLTHQSFDALEDELPLIEDIDSIADYLVFLEAS